jgi:hypothetical protein
MAPGRLRVALVRTSQLLFLNVSVGRRSSERPGSNVGIIFHFPICLVFLVDYLTSFA